MAYIKVTIDGETVLDGESGTWEQRPPDFIAQQLHNMTTSTNPVPPSPWMRSIMLILAEAAMTETYASIEVSTRGNAGWSLDVKYSVELDS